MDEKDFVPIEKLNTRVEVYDQEEVMAERRRDNLRQFGIKAKIKASQVGVGLKHGISFIKSQLAEAKMNRLKRMGGRALSRVQSRERRSPSITSKFESYNNPFQQSSGNNPFTSSSGNNPYDFTKSKKMRR